MGNYKINLDLGAENTRMYEFHFKVTERDPDYGDEHNRDYTAIYGEVGGRKFIAVPGSLENFIIDSFMRTDVRKEIVRTLKKEYEEGRCRTLDTRLHAFVMEVLNEYQTVIQRETVIYGNYGNKNFILFPGFSNEQGHFIEIGGPGDIEYNSKKLEEYNKKTFGYYRYGNSPGHRRRWDTVSIAEAVCEHWKTAEKEVPDAEESTAELSEEEEKDRFTAKECNFQGEPGYMVSQFHEGKKAVEQFIPKSSYKFFCEATGVRPEIISGQEDKTQKPHSAEHIHEREER